MATTKAKFDGWSFKFKEQTEEAEEYVPSCSFSSARRGRRGAAGSTLVLTREIDGFTVKSGDTIVFNDEGEGKRVVYLITGSVIGTGNYIVTTGLGFLAAHEVDEPPPDTCPQEIFLTCVTNEVFVEDIIERANVLNEFEFSKITIDDSNRGNTFLCRRGYDTSFERCSQPFDIREAQENIRANALSEEQRLRDIIVKRSSRLKRPKYPTTTRESAKKNITPYEVRPETDEAPKETERPLGVRDEPKTTLKLVDVPIEVRPDHVEARTRSKRTPSRSLHPSKRRQLDEMVIDLSDDGNLESHGSNSLSIYTNRKRIMVDGVSDSDRDGASESGVDTSHNSLSSSPSEDELDNDDKEDELFSDDDEFRPISSYIRRNRATQRTKARVLPVVKSSRKDSRLMGPKSILESQSAKTTVNNVQTLPCRELQFAEIYSSIESCIEIEKGTSIYVSGTPGTGKTATVREVVRQLHRKSKAGELTPFDYLELNGMKMLTPQSAYELMWNKISKERAPSVNLQMEIESYFQNQKAKTPMVVLIDELDQVATKSSAVLYNFFNWPILSNSKLITIAVANTMDLPERVLTNKTSSRLGLHRIQFPGYTHEELVKIIHARFEVLTQGNVELKDDAIEFVARKIASVSGDARRALKICQRAIEIAKKSSGTTGKTGNGSKGLVQVQAVHINRAIIETVSSPMAQFIKDLPYSSKLILIAILSKKRKSGLAENSLGDVIDEIRQIITTNATNDIAGGKTPLTALYEEDIIRPRYFDYAMNELLESGLVLQQNKKSNRNSIVKLNVADEEITSVFKNDGSLKFFEGLTSSSS